MVKLLGTIILILSIILFPPAALAVISNNAVPGDATYPVKRSLENVIVAAASINPTTRAWFSQTRSNRRYKEFTALIAQGKKTSDTLSELVEQTDIAAGQITQVSDPTQKQKLIEQLSQSIAKYDEGLKQASQPSSEPPAAIAQAKSDLAQVPNQENPTLEPVSPTAQPTIQPAVGLAARRAAGNIQPTPVPTPKPAVTVQPATAKSSPTPKPEATSQPILNPQVTSKPTAQPAPVSEKDEEAEKQKKKELEEARKKLEEIRKRLAEEQKRQAPTESGRKEKSETPKEKDKTGKDK